MQGLDRWAQFNTFMDDVSPHLSSIARDVWIAMFRHADINGRTWATRGRVSGMIGACRSHVSNGIKELKEKKLIAKIDGDNGYVLSLGVYQSVQGCLPECTGVSNGVDGGCLPECTGVSNGVDGGCLPECTGVSNGVDTLQNTLTEPYTEPYTETNVSEDEFSLQTETQKPKQTKLPKTSRTDWKAKASSTFLFEALKMYPAHRRTYRPKEFQTIWDEAAKEEGGHDVLWNTVREHLRQAVTSEDWIKECGKYVPSMENYIGKRKYRAPVKIAVDAFADIDEKQPF